MGDWGNGQDIQFGLPEGELYVFRDFNSAYGWCPKKFPTNEKICAIIISQPEGWTENDEWSVMSMLWLISGLIFMMNEWSSGERWLRGVVRNVAVISLLVLLAELLPGQTLMLAIVAFSGCVAAELYRCFERKPQEQALPRPAAVREAEPEPMVPALPRIRATVRKRAA